MSNYDTIVALLFLLTAVIVWLAFEAQRLRLAIEPLATSPLATALARAGT